VCTRPALTRRRLSHPPGADKVSHNEALASHIAALNMLDLDVCDAAPQVDKVVQA
jgi:hypothetical protein